MYTMIRLDNNTNDNCTYMGSMQKDLCESNPIASIVHSTQGATVSIDVHGEWNEV